MSVCAAIKPDGVRCKARAMKGSQWCFNHHPDYSQERRRNASKGGRRGGRGRPSSELSRLQERFEELAEQVLSGEVERGVGAVAAQLLNGARACIATRLKAIEQEEVLERLEELEQIVERQNEYRRSGAW
jgi:hypothetical protein